MGYTKLQIIELAYEEIGLGGYVFDLEADQLQSACRRLDLLAAQLEAKKSLGGYVFPATGGTTDPATELEISELAANCLYLGLAIKLGPTVGKQVMPETKVAYQDAFNQLHARATYPPSWQRPSSLPKGAGNKPYGTRSEYFTGPQATNPSELNQILDD